MLHCLPPLPFKLPGSATGQRNIVFIRCPLKWLKIIISASGRLQHHKIDNYVYSHVIDHDKHSDGTKWKVWPKWHSEQFKVRQLSLLQRCDLIASFLLQKIFIAFRSVNSRTKQVKHRKWLVWHGPPCMLHAGIHSAVRWLSRWQFPDVIKPLPGTRHTRLQQTSADRKHRARWHICRCHALQRNRLVNGAMMTVLQHDWCR